MLKDFVINALKRSATRFEKHNGENQRQAKVLPVLSLRSWAPAPYLKDTKTKTRARKTSGNNFFDFSMEDATNFSDSFHQQGGFYCEN
jgi:hypothetical protein